MLDGAAPLRRRADHVASGVLQEDQRRAGLVTQLYELPGLGRAGGLDRAVVTQDANQMALHSGVATDHFTSVGSLELQKIRTVDQAGDDLAYVIGFALIGGDYAHQFLLVKQRFGKCGGSGRGVPTQLVHHLTRHANGMSVVFAQVFAQTRHLGVGFGAS